MDLVLVVDSERSIGDSQWNDLLNFLTAFVDSLDVGMFQVQGTLKRTEVSFWRYFAPMIQSIPTQYNSSVTNLGRNSFWLDRIDVLPVFCRRSLEAS